MSYFTAVMAGDERGWRARDIDVEDAGTLDDLADVLRGASYRNGPVLAVIEREDEWFALVRVDGEDDPRVFVSDMHAAARSPYAELLAPAVDVEAVVDIEDDDVVLTAAGPDPDDDDHEPDAAELASDTDPGDTLVQVRDPWAGEPDLLDDLGFSGRRLVDLVVEQSDDPAGVLAEVGEACGFGGLLDALR